MIHDVLVAAGPLAVRDRSGTRTDAAVTSWVELFHAGDHAVLDRCYREHFETIRGAVGRVLQGADRDSVVHDVFYRLVSERHLRENFRGGNFAPWLTRVARNQAIDFRRRHERDRLALAMEPAPGPPAASLGTINAKLLVEKFRKDRLPEKLHGVFEMRFLRQLSQREAAAELGIQRTTLVYQEQLVRHALRAFVLEEGE